MDDNRKPSIAAALNRYCETVSEHNLTLVSALVETLETLPPPSNCTETRAQFLRLRRLDYYLGTSWSAMEIKSPSDLLGDDMREEVLRRLDGVAPHAQDSVEVRGRYFSAVGARIADLDVVVTEFPPADLAYLCTLVDGITGPGLRYHRVSQQIELLSCAGEGLEDDVAGPVRLDEDKELDESKLTDGDQLSDLWLDWEIAVVFQIGVAPFTGGSFAVYCRREAGGGDWGWRYGIHDEDWCSELYGGVEEFLNYYTHFREQTEDEVRADVRGEGLHI